jgi:hypothetical protein
MASAMTVSQCATPLFDRWGDAIVCPSRIARKVRALSESLCEAFWRSPLRRLSQVVLHGAHHAPDQRLQHFGERRATGGNLPYFCVGLFARIEGFRGVMLCLAPDARQTLWCRSACTNWLELRQHALERHKMWRVACGFFGFAASSGPEAPP